MADVATLAYCQVAQRRGKKKCNTGNEKSVWDAVAGPCDTDVSISFRNADKDFLNKWFSTKNPRRSLSRTNKFTVTALRLKF